MSVDVKTPTRTQFEHAEFQCGKRGGTMLETVITTSVTTVSVGGITLHSQNSVPAASAIPSNEDSFQSQATKGHRKRKLSERGGNPYQFPNRKKPYRKSGDKIVLPSRFLLGGNINDPLNLNALYDDEIGKALNERTPQSSPLPLPEYKKEVKVLIPPNINDPLNLNAGEEGDVGLVSPKFGSKKKKHKHKKKRPSTGPAETEIAGESCASQDVQKPIESARPVTLDLSSSKDPVGVVVQKDVSVGDKITKVIDRIVSPVIPQVTPKPKKSKRLSSEVIKVDGEPFLGKDSDKSELRKTTPQRPKVKRQTSHQTAAEAVKSRKDKNRFEYGNYGRYYGYRNPGAEVDNRLSTFREEWFCGKDVLDIGCNIGHITLSVARDFCPRRIVGMDIDNKLISTAKKNIRHYLTKDVADLSKFPVSSKLTNGPMVPPPVPHGKHTSGFPYNVMFVQGNYVLETDEELELIQEEYDTILALSLTKWIHLNWGDDGIKRTFRRIYSQLRPGGRLILEPQPWSSYKRKKKVSDTVYKNFQQINFRPEHFTEYLLSKDVGFVACEHVDTPYNRSQGFQRPIQVFIKAESGTTPVEGVTPLMDINCTPGTTPQTYALHKDGSRGATPRFDVGSTGITPCSSCQNTPTYLYNTWSASGTPQNDSDTGDGCTQSGQDNETARSLVNCNDQQDFDELVLNDNG
ncbi:hypothetical protein LSH36_660g02002 [Paralvinella palmiformis]|uniref:RNA methyltransferase n=1 Tax=Paralvinella palmiformis TaxID=53620 RepID=A0AAD9J346_9ANNE|nr:hypothetical protein LSH36_660g02002 [Paralvinella palmiformis]